MAQAETRLIRVPAETHAKLAAEAERQRRSIGAQVAVLADGLPGGDVARED